MAVVLARALRCAVWVAALLPAARLGAAGTGPETPASAQAAASSAASTQRVSPYVLAAQRHAQEASGVSVPVSPATMRHPHRPPSRARQP